MEDARIDVFKGKVQKRLAEARASNLPALQLEIQQLRSDMTISLAEPVTLPETTSPVPMLDLFAFEKPIETSLGKRPYTDKDPQARCVRARRVEEKGLERTLRESRREAEIRQA